MRMSIIGNAEAVLGFSLVGVHGQVTGSAAEVNQALDEVMGDSEVGIVLVTEDVARLIPARMERLKMRSTVPLVVEIPGPQGPSPDQLSLSEVVQRAVGVKF